MDEQRTAAVRVLALESENVKRLKAVSITPKGDLVVIGGRNAQGKTSVLDSIMYALAGKRAIPQEPLRRGAKHGSVKVTLGSEDGLAEELLVTRTFTEAGGGQLTVESKNGALYRSPQKILDALLGALTFDPLEFAGMDAREQGDVLRELVGIDHRELDGQRLKAFNERAGVNRDAKSAGVRLADMPSHEGVVDPVSTKEAEAALEDAEQQVAAISEARRQLEVSAVRVSQAENAVIDLSAKLKEADERLRAEQKDQAQRAEDLTREEKDAPDQAALREALAETHRHNVKLTENEAHVAASVELTALQQKARALTEKIAKLDAKKRAEIAKAEFPVEGLSLDPETGIALYRGLPFEQASQAEQLQVSMATAIASNPGLRVAFIRDGSLLDEEHMALVAKLAEEADAQVWIERVGDKDPGAIVIEDGQVVGAEEAPDEAEQPETGPSADVQS